MKEAFEVIATSPLPTILGVGGIFFLFLALVGKVGGKLIIDIPPDRQKGFAVAGTALLMGGAFLYIAPLLDQRTPEPTQLPLPSPTPTPSVVVAFRTFHGRYITATDEIDEATGEITDWKLKGKAQEINDWEKFTLFCLDNGKVALKTFHGRYATATDASWDWVLRAETSDRLACEEFTLVDAEVDADTGEQEQLSCLQVFERLKRGEVKIALQNVHKKGDQNRYVTAMDYKDESTGKIWDWVIRAETDVLSDWEKFTMIPQQ